jgi:hypothetical protein
LQLSLHLRAHTAIQGNPETLEMSSGWYDMYDGLSFLVGHGLFCITRIERDG